MKTANRFRRLAGVAAAAMLCTGIATTAAEAAVPKPFKNCTELNKTYKHGVGKKSAKDRIGGKYVAGKSVTTFKKSDSIYAKAMKANKGLDRDKDGVACEKR